MVLRNAQYRNENVEDTQSFRGRNQAILLVELESSSLDAVFTYLREEGCQSVEDVEAEKNTEAEEFAQQMRTAGAVPQGFLNGEQRWCYVTHDPSGKKRYRGVKSVEDIEHLKGAQDAIDYQPEETD